MKALFNNILSPWPFQSFSVQNKLQSLLKCRRIDTVIVLLACAAFGSLVVRNFVAPMINRKLQAEDSHKKTDGRNATIFITAFNALLVAVHFAMRFYPAPSPAQAVVEIVKQHKQLNPLKDKISLPQDLGWAHAVRSQEMDGENRESLDSDDPCPNNVSWQLEYILSAFSCQIFEHTELEEDELADGIGNWNSLTLTTNCLAELQAQNPLNKRIAFVAEQLQYFKQSCLIRLWQYETVQDPEKMQEFYLKLSRDPSYVKKSLAKGTILSEPVDPYLLFRQFLGKLIGEIQSLNNHNSSMIFEGSIYAEDDSHMMIHSIRRENNGSYTFTVLNTSDPDKNHATEIINGIEHIYPLTITGLTLQAVTNREFLSKIFIKTTYLGDHTVREIEEQIQDNYNLIHKYLVIEGRGKVHKKSGVPYPEQVKDSCMQSSINMFLAQHLTPKELAAFKQIAEKDLCARLKVLQTRVIPQIPREDLAAEDKLLKRLKAVEQIQGRLQSRL